MNDIPSANPLKRILPTDTPGAILEALAAVNDYGLAGYGLVSAVPGPEEGQVTMTVAHQLDTVLAQVRSRVLGRQKR